MLIDQLGYEEYVIDKRLWMSLRRCLDYQELLLGRNVTVAGYGCRIGPKSSNNRECENLALVL